MSCIIALVLVCCLLEIPGHGATAQTTPTPYQATDGAAYGVTNSPNQMPQHGSSRDPRRHPDDPSATNGNTYYHGPEGRPEGAHTYTNPGSHPNRAHGNTNPGSHPVDHSATNGNTFYLGPEGRPDPNNPRGNTHTGSHLQGGHGNTHPGSHPDGAHGNTNPGSNPVDHSATNGNTYYRGPEGRPDPNNPRGTGSHLQDGQGNTHPGTHTGSHRNGAQGNSLPGSHTDGTHGRTNQQGSPRGPELVPNYGRIEPQSGPELVPNYGRQNPDSSPQLSTRSGGGPDSVRYGEQGGRPFPGPANPQINPDGNRGHARTGVNPNGNRPNPERRPYPGVVPERRRPGIATQPPLYQPYDQNQPDYGYRYGQYGYTEYNRGRSGGSYIPGSRNYGVPTDQYRSAYPWGPAPSRSYDYGYSHQHPRQAVAFSATSGSSQTFYKAGAVIFNEVITNIGDGYNYRYGVFRAPVTGIYIVTYHGASNPKGDKPAELDLLRNFRVVNSARGQGQAGMASNSAVLFLNRYDQISIQGRAGTAIFCETGHAFCSFNAALINIGMFSHSSLPYGFPAPQHKK